MMQFCHTNLAPKSNPRHVSYILCISSLNRRLPPSTKFETPYTVKENNATMYKVLLAKLPPPAAPSPFWSSSVFD